MPECLSFRWLSTALVLLLLALPAAGARSAEIPGADEPDFDVTLRAWLADNDSAALPALAELAAEGNTAAQILVALIDRRPETHGEWVSTLSRSGRRALMRTPEGRAWMEAAAAEAELARLWLRLWDAETDPAVAFDFADLGEVRAARLVLLAHASRERGGFAALAEDPRFPPELLYLAANETGAEARERVLADLHPGDPQRIRLGGERPEPPVLANWLREAPIAAPVSLFCAEACGDDPDACALAAYEALGGYRGLFTLGSPSETLVPPDIWHASAKGAQSIPRRIAVLGARAGDECLAQFVGR